MGNTVNITSSVIGGIGMFSGDKVTEVVADKLKNVSDRIGALVKETNPSIEVLTEAMHKVMEKDKLAFASADVSQTTAPRQTPGKMPSNEPKIS